MKTNFTQIYDKTYNQAIKLLKQENTKSENEENMPIIDNAKLLLDDIYKNKCDSSIMKWIYEHAK